MIGRSGVGARGTCLSGKITRAALSVALSLWCGGSVSARPTLDQLVTVASARATVRISSANVYQNRLVSHDGDVRSVEKVEEVGRRFLREDEVIALLLSDPDGDGVVSILDAAPGDGAVQKRSQLMAQGARRATDPLEQVLLQFGEPEEMVEALLGDNAALGLYDADRLVDALEQAGFPPASCQGWRSRFGSRGKKGSSPGDESPESSQKGGQK